MSGLPNPDPRHARSLTTVVSATIAQCNFSVESVDLGNPRYELCGEIDRGGMGLICRARDLLLRRDVAVKVLWLSPEVNQPAVRSFASEARIMSYLAHPGVAPIYDSGVCTDGRPYYVMKLIDGTTLADMLLSERHSTAELLNVFVDVCQTIAFAHSRGIIHLDLKPGNVMVGAFGEVQVMDWGLARFVGARPDDFDNWFGSEDVLEISFGPQSVNGTPGYMSPEQARCEQLDARADVFGLGGILCEILIGHAPYQGHNVRQIYANALRAEMDSTFAGLEDCDTDRALVQLARRCLSPRLSDRPASAIEVARVIAAYQETALQKIESDMNRFFELSLDLFCIADFEGYFRSINANFPRVLGYTESELLARPFLDLVHPADQQQTIEKMSILHQGQPVVRFRNRYRAADQSYVTLEWTAKAIEAERIIFAVARDVTVRPL